MDATNDNLLIFILFGVIILIWEAVNFTRTPQYDLQLHNYSEADVFLPLYTGDGTTNTYEPGDFCLTQISWNDEIEDFLIKNNDRNVFIYP